MSSDRNWYTIVHTSHVQDLIVEEGTGKSIAVAYDKDDAPLVAASPKLLKVCRELLEVQEGLKGKKTCKCDRLSKAFKLARAAVQEVDYPTVMP